MADRFEEEAVECFNRFDWFPDPHDDEGIEFVDALAAALRKAEARGMRTAQDAVVALGGPDTTEDEAGALFSAAAAIRREREKLEKGE